MNYVIILCSAVVLIVIVFACSKGQDSTKTEESKTPVTIPVENVSPTNDQLERRKTSEAFCTSNDIPIYKNPNALFVGAEANVNVRTQNEVVDRACALFFMGLKSEGLEEKHLGPIINDFGLLNKFSPKEKEYALNKSPSQQETTNANWRYEGLHVMLWALGYIENLSYPDELCNVADDVKVIHDLTESGFRKNAKLRSKKEILDQADLILRLHWACVNAQIKNEEAPGNLNSSIIIERHYALNWLIKYANQNWDDVSTDT